MSLRGLLSLDVTLERCSQLGDHSIDVTLEGTDVALGCDIRHLAEVTRRGCVSLQEKDQLHVY